jgi:pimeloyl-ACP methyl ester carboxylesterase
LRPPRPVLVGLSIGGLFAARAFLAAGNGVPRIAGLALLNTLRKPGPRLDWINDAVFSAVRFGGTTLVGDLFSPMLFHEDWLAANRAGALRGEYVPADPDGGVYRLLDDARQSNWDIAWEQIHVPVLVATGLADRVFRVDEDIEELTARLPRPTSVTVPNAGHMLPVEVPDALCRYLNDWVAEASEVA